MRIRPRPPWPPCPHARSIWQLAETKGSTVKDLQKIAKEKLGIEFSDDQTGFQLSDLWARRRRGEMANQVGAG